MDADIWLDFSAMFAELFEYAHALEVLETGLSHQPDNVALEFRKVAYLYSLGKPKEAHIQLQAALVHGKEGLAALFEFAPYLQNDQVITAIIDSL